MESGDANLSDDQIFAMRQAARHVCGALKKYFEAHLVVKAEEVRRSHIRSDGSSPLQETPAYKVRELYLSTAFWEGCTFVGACMPALTCWQKQTHMHAHVYMHACTHAHVCARVHTHTHTHTNTFSLSFIFLLKITIYARRDAKDTFSHIHMHILLTLMVYAPK